MHNRFFVLILGVLCVLSCSKKIDDYSDFKKGVFFLYKDNQLIYKIERDQQFQIEINTVNDEIESMSNLNWISDTRLELTPVKSKHNNVNSLFVDFYKKEKDTAYITVRYSKPWFEKFRKSYYKLVKKDATLSQRFYDAQ